MSVVVWLCLALLAAAPASAIRAGTSHSISIPFTDKACNPRQIHLAMGNSPEEMIVQWEADSANCKGKVKCEPAEQNDAPASEAEAGVIKLTPDMFCEAPAGSADHRDTIIYRATLKDLEPDLEYTYQIAGESVSRTFRAAPAVGESHDPYPYTFVAFGDMGEAEDSEAKSPGAQLVAEQAAKDVANGARMVLHIGDISYANGKRFVWENFMAAIAGMANYAPYMVGIGNHDYDYSAGIDKDPSGAARPYLPSWGNFKPRGSGGECGVATWARFEMPSADEVPENGSHGDYNPPFWYAFDLATTHFVVVSSEHDLSPGSRQWKWLRDELASVDRCVTPWVVLAIHRPLYVLLNHRSNRVVAEHLRGSMEPLLRKYGVNYVINGHVHSYSRTCPVLGAKCTPEAEGGRYHFIIGSGGRKLSKIKKMKKQDKWVDYAEQTWGHGRFTVRSAQRATMEFVRGYDGETPDSVEIHNHVADTGLCKYRYVEGKEVEATPAIDEDDSDVIAASGAAAASASFQEVMRHAADMLKAHEDKIADVGMGGMAFDELDWGAESLAIEQSVEENQTDHYIYRSSDEDDDADDYDDEA